MALILCCVHKYALYNLQCILMSGYLFAGLPHNEVVPRLKDKVMNFKQVMPCITSLRNPSLRARHWYQIEGIIGKAIEHDKSFTLGNLLEMKVICVAMQYKIWCALLKQCSPVKYYLKLK